MDEPFRTPGYDGPEGTEWPRPDAPHRFCTIEGPHPAHGMALQGYSGQICGGR